MKLGKVSCSTLLALAAVAACAPATEVVVHEGPALDGGPGGTAADGGATTPAESDDPADQPAHALGSIVLGEGHASGAGTSTGIVSVTFFPDARLAGTCEAKLEGGCTLTTPPKCAAVPASPTGCNTSEVCTRDAATCTTSCKPFVQCEAACATGEVCQAQTAGSTTGTCVPMQGFDAGPLAFRGTTTAITLLPPYPFTRTADGAPFLGGATLHAVAAGAAGAGFDAFDETFTATTFLQASPPLASLSRAVVFGAGPLPVSWVPGADTVTVSISGTGGTAACTADDAAGTFAVPRSVIEAAQGTTGTNSGGSGPLTVSLTRKKTDVHKDLHARGTLAGETVQPQGWLELVTVSTESTSF